MSRIRRFTLLSLLKSLLIFSLSSDEAVEQVQGNQHSISGVCGCSHREGGVSKRSAGGQRWPQRWDWQTTHTHTDTCSVLLVKTSHWFIFIPWPQALTLILFTEWLTSTSNLQPFDPKIPLLNKLTGRHFGVRRTEQHRSTSHTLCHAFVTLDSQGRGLMGYQFSLNELSN